MQARSNRIGREHPCYRIESLAKLCLKRKAEEAVLGYPWRARRVTRTVSEALTFRYYLVDLRQILVRQIAELRVADTTTFEKVDAAGTRYNRCCPQSSRSQQGPLHNGPFCHVSFPSLAHDLSTPFRQEMVSEQLLRSILSSCEVQSDVLICCTGLQVCESTKSS